jgi:hypothetical protein
VLTLIKEYGALICVTVTTCRKAITIILSFTLFSKPFVFEYVKNLKGEMNITLPKGLFGRAILFI